MKIFRASYSVLSTWESGNWERAIEMYFKLADYVTPAMVDGREMHKKWEDYAKKNNKMPEVFGGAKLYNPIIEKKHEIQLEDWLEFVFIPDLVDAPNLIDYKTGRSNPSAKAVRTQLGLYAVGLDFFDINVSLGKLYHYNQYTKKVNLDIVCITDKLKAEAREYLYTVSSEMHDYFEKNDLYNKLGKNVRN